MSSRSSTSMEVHRLTYSRRFRTKLKCITRAGQATWSRYWRAKTNQYTRMFQRKPSMPHMHPRWSNKLRGISWMFPRLMISVQCIRLGTSTVFHLWLEPIRKRSCMRRIVRRPRIGRSWMAFKRCRFKRLMKKRWPWDLRRALANRWWHLLQFQQMKSNKRLWFVSVKVRSRPPQNFMTREWLPHPTSIAMKWRNQYQTRSATPPKPCSKVSKAPNPVASQPKIQSNPWHQSTWWDNTMSFWSHWPLLIRIGTPLSPMFSCSRSQPSHGSNWHRVHTTDQPAEKESSHQQSNYR